MLKSIKYICITSLLLLVPILFKPDVAQAVGFKATCSRVRYGRDAIFRTKRLEAFCKNTRGQTLRSTISLNYIIANDNGTLRWRRGGGFENSCRNVHVQFDPVRNTYILTAWCAIGGIGGGHGSRLNKIDLDVKINNINGRLKSHDIP